jgi:hypothetical protein
MAKAKSMIPHFMKYATAFIAVWCNADLARVSANSIFTAAMEKFKKIDKEFLLSDSSLNCYSFRLLTSGYQLADFKKNPIGYRMHKREDGVIVKWEDLRVDGDKVYGKPVINLSNAKGQQTVDEIVNGFLNAASVGHLVALEISKDPKDYLAGQEGPTVTKWYNRECSLVDIPGNYNALTDLVDENDNPINLADFKIQNINMKQIILSAAQLALLNLKDDSDTTVVETTIKDLVAKAAKVDSLTTDLAAATTAKAAAEIALADFKKLTITSEVNKLVDDAVTKTLCTIEAGEMYKKLFADKPDELKALVATMKPYTSVTSQIQLSAVNDVEVAELIKLSGEELFKQGKLERLKELSAAHYKIKYKEYFEAEAPAEA